MSADKKSTTTKKKAAKKATKKKTVKAAAGATKTTAKQKRVKKVAKKPASRAVAPKQKAVTAPKATRLRVRQVRSGIGSAGSMRRTLVALGLKHHQDVVTVPDNPSVRGMLRKVSHLIQVATAEE